MGISGLGSKRIDGPAVVAKPLDVGVKPKPAGIADGFDRAPAPRGFVPSELGPGGLGKEGGGSRVDKRIVAYEKFVAAGPPERSDYPDPAQYQLAYDRYLEERDALLEAAGPAYVEQAEAALEATPTGAAVLEAAERAGVEVQVIPDAEYERRFGGSSANTEDGVVYVKASELASDRGPSILLHEFVHATVDSLDPKLPQELREFGTAASFARFGLDPKGGAEVAKATEGWCNDVAAEHVATHVLEHELAREQAGLPPESPEDRAEYIERTAEHELAIHLRNREADAKEKGEPYTDEQLLEDWASTPQGRANPPPGDTPEEQAANLRAMLEEMASEEWAPIEPQPPARPMPGGGKFPGGD